MTDLTLKLWEIFYLRFMFFSSLQVIYLPMHPFGYFHHNGILKMTFKSFECLDSSYRYVHSCFFFIFCKHPIFWSSGLITQLWSHFVLSGLCAKGCQSFTYTWESCENTCFCPFIRGVCAVNFYISIKLPGIEAGVDARLLFASPFFFFTNRLIKLGGVDPPKHLVTESC